MPVATSWDGFTACPNVECNWSIMDGSVDFSANRQVIAARHRTRAYCRLF